MAGKDNLKPFKKGKEWNGNAKGRPKLPDLGEAMAKLLGGEDEEKSGLKRVLAALQLRAENGDTKAIEILLDRGYGKAKQTIDMKTEHSGEVTIERHIKNKDADKP